MIEPVVLIDVDSRGVATLTLNRPSLNNAYNAAMLVALSGAIGDLAGNQQIRAIVIRGNGPHFQAGADLTWVSELSTMDAQGNLAASELTAAAMRDLNELEIPTIALVHGACIGGGTGIIASVDIVIAQSDSVFAISEARWGMVASIIVPQLNHAIGTRQARRYALSCERFSAQRAREIGLVHEICPPGELDAFAEQTLQGILLAEPNAVRETKRTILECAGAKIAPHAFNDLVEIHASKRQSPEAAEGLRSFHEKRDPQWYAAPPGLGESE